jgi:hypothetical protein
MASSVSSIREVPQIHQCVLQESLVQETLDAMNAIPAEQRIKWTTAKLYRETIEFGVIYHQLEEDKRVEVPMLESVAKVRHVLHERFRDKIAEGSRPEDFDNCIVSIYKAGGGMVPHVDRAVTGAKDGRARKYYFGDSILGLILVPDTRESIYFTNPETGEKIFLKEEKGTAFLFQGALRQKWKHALDPIATSRVSVTFRKVNFKP